MNPTLALVGNPNSGKTTLFNALTGLRHKVGNYPGVTVERKEGTVQLPAGVPLRVVDLPGLYSLSPNSPDEGIARDELMGSLPGERRPDLLLNVVDASNLERNLFLTTQLIEAGCSVVVVLTMHDLARARGVEVDGKALAERLGVPVVSVDLRRGAGLREMLDVVAARLGDARNGGGAQSAEAVDRVWTRCPEIVDSVNRIAGGIEALHGLAGAPAAAEALLLLSLPAGATLERQMARWSIPVREATAEIRRDLEARGVDVPTVLAEERYAHIGGVVARAMHRFDAGPVTWEERLDRVFLHRVWGYVVFLGVLLLVFEAMFTWASIPADALQAGVEWLGGRVAPLLPKGDLREMVVAGVFGGVGNTIVFLQQILILFLFITLLEDTGYLARAAFLMDRLMSRVGLHGKSFVPLLSSYACAIPGVLATRV
ncbi:MAG: ferrous iron transport protein B, partial [Armatimonadota bacterium]